MRSKCLECVLLAHLGMLKGIQIIIRFERIITKLYAARNILDLLSTFTILWPILVMALGNILLYTSSFKLEINWLPRYITLL